MLYASSSFDRMVDELGDFFRGYDEAWYDRHVRGVLMTTLHATATAPATAPAGVARATCTGGPPARLGLPRAVGGQRPHHGRIPVSAFGFTCTAYAGPETGVRHKASYVLEQGDIRLVVSAALDADSPIAAHVRHHGDGVHDLAWLVNDARAAFAAAVAARRASGPATLGGGDDQGVLVLAQIGTYGHTVHTFVDRRRYTGPRLEPGYHTDHLPAAPVGPPVGLAAIDHVVGNVEQGRLEDWVRVLRRGPRLRPDAALLRGADRHGVLRVGLHRGVGRQARRHAHQRAGHRPAQEPDRRVPGGLRRPRRAARRAAHGRHRVDRRRAEGARRALHGGARHLLRRGHAGVSTAFRLPWSDLQRLGILVDRDAGGHLLQIFTETITDRPAVFFEIIERRGARGFGEGNFKALFEAIVERDPRRGEATSLRTPPVPASAPTTSPLGWPGPGAGWPTWWWPSGTTPSTSPSARTGLVGEGIDPAVFCVPHLNALLAQGPEVWRAVRHDLRELLVDPERSPTRPGSARSGPPRPPGGGW